MSSFALSALDVSQEPEDQCAASAMCMHRVKFGYKVDGRDAIRWAPSVYRTGRQIWRLLQVFNIHIANEEHFAKYASSNPSLYGAKMEYNVSKRKRRGDDDTGTAISKRRKLHMDGGATGVPQKKDTEEEENEEGDDESVTGDEKLTKKKKKKKNAKQKYPVNKALVITLPRVNASNRRKKNRTESFMDKARKEPVRPDQIGQLHIGNVVCNGTAIGNTHLDLTADWMYAKRQNFPHCAVTVRGKGTVSIYRSNKFSATGSCSPVNHLLSVYLVLMHHVRQTGEYVHPCKFASVNVIGTGYAGHKLDLMKRKRRFERLGLCPRYDTGKGAFTGMHVRIGSHKVTVTQHEEGMYNFVGMRDMLEVNMCLHDYVPLITAECKEIGRGEVYVSDDDEDDNSKLDQGDDDADDDEEVDV